MIAHFQSLKQRLRWWYAKRRGERPQCGCDGCDSSATLHLSPEGYRCGMCYARGQPYQGVGFMRDLEPEDYLKD